MILIIGSFIKYEFYQNLILKEKVRSFRKRFRKNKIIKNGKKNSIQEGWQIS